MENVLLALKTAKLVTPNNVLLVFQRHTYRMESVLKHVQKNFSSLREPSVFHVEPDARLVSLKNHVLLAEILSTCLKGNVCPTAKKEESLLMENVRNAEPTVFNVTL
jgi:hypothetical protein